jgi:hemolysin activation/secretion protein
MTVAPNFERTAVELTYDKSLVEGDTINVRAENPEDGDVSTRDDLKNDGRFVWTVPAGYKGVSQFTVAGSEGGSDTGEVDWADYSAV